MGFDIFNLSPKYRSLVDDQVRLARSEGKHVLDVGAGTGNISEALAKTKVASLTACDLVPEALERLRKKVESHLSISTTACNIDGTPTIAMLRWVSGDLHSPMELAGRLPGTAGGFPFDAGKFDVIVCSLVLSYLNNRFSRTCI